MNKIKFNLIMEVIALHSIVLRLMGFSKWEIRDNSKTRAKLFSIANELTKEFN